jgi:puromycin-sensitive aminopeptidase
MPESTPYKLSRLVLPLNYDLVLQPDLEKFTFSGHETLELEVVEPTNEIVLNASELEIEFQRLVASNNTVVGAATMTVDEDLERVSFHFEDELQPGKVLMDLAFRGTLNDQLRGFYRSQYLDGDGNERYLASTQFEATDARRAFPCWDEPSFKATFDITLVVPEELAAISNTAMVSETTASTGLRTVKFERSPKMSTYLVAFIVGDMASVEEQTPSGTLIRVWATKGREEQGRYALDNAVRLLSYFNDYFGIPFPLSKLDHIAIPDFAAGAMENWGAITYRETALLYDPENSAAAARQRIVEVIAHEMAHMWFGDLVTMAWWDDLWLNESFASWMGDKSVDNLYPEWAMWTQFVSADTNSGLSLDGLRNSHPIEANVGNPSEIRELFDAISYSKGGATLRMLEQFLGPDTFQKGLQAYLSEHQYGNAQTRDLWRALSQASGLPVENMMDSWVKQTGYPLLTLDSSSDTTEAIQVTQERFLYDHLLTDQSDDTSLWQIPVRVATAASSEPQVHLVEEKGAVISLDSSVRGAADQWIVVNAGRTGFYRSRYEGEAFKRIVTAISRKELPAVDRLGIQDDTYALVRAGFGSATDFLELAAAYKDEDDASVWTDLAMNLKGFEALLYDQPYLGAFRAFALSIFSGIASRVGWDASSGEGHRDALLRATVLGQAGGYGDEATLKTARDRCLSFLSTKSPIHPDIRGVVYGLAALTGDSQLYENLWDLEREATLQEEKMRLLGALARFQTPDLLSETLKRALGSDVRAQDAPLVVVAVASANPEGRDLAWNFLRENWFEFDRRYGRGGFAIARLVGIAGGFATAERASEVTTFFNSNPAPSAARAIDQAVERIHLNTRWIEKNAASLQGWFA